jgi:hypothetical protein
MHRRFARLHHTGLALLAALALAVLPTLARALEPMAATPVWADLCRNTASPDTLHALQACSYCVLAASPVLPPCAPALHLRRDVAAPDVAATGAGRPVGPVRTVGAARAPPRPA